MALKSKEERGKILKDLQEQSKIKAKENKKQRTKRKRKDGEKRLHTRQEATGNRRRRTKKQYRAELLNEENQRLKANKEGRGKPIIESSHPKLYIDDKDFFDKFGTNEQCAAVVKKMFYPNGVTCPYCQSNKIWEYTKEFHYKCSNCLEQFNVYTLNIFMGRRIPKWKILLAIIAENTTLGGVTISELLPRINLTEKTCFYLLQEIKTYCFDLDILEEILNDINSGFKLKEQDNNTPAQFDVTHKQGDSRNDHAHKKDEPCDNDAKIAVLVQPKRLAKARIVEDESEKSLSEAIDEMLAEGLGFYCDKHASHVGMQNAERLKKGKGRIIKIVNHKSREYVRKEVMKIITQKTIKTKVEVITTNLVELVNGILKIGLWKHQRNYTIEGLALYIVAQLQRFNMRHTTSSDKLILCLMIHARKLKPMKQSKREKVEAFLLTKYSKAIVKKMIFDRPYQIAA